MSWECPPESSTAVTMLVRTPVMACNFTHARDDCSLPHLWSYHRSNRLIEKPVESTAKSVSTALRGSADTSTNWRRASVISGDRR